MRFQWLSFFVLSCVLSAGTPEIAKSGMVSSDSSHASAVGRDILKQGGNAIDAAVACGFALAVTEPSAGNLGGGGFMVIRLADGTTTTLDFREVAPKTASRDMYLDKNGDIIPNLSLLGHKAAAVPGSVDGLLRVHEKYGNLSRQAVLKGAIDLARNGIPVSHRMLTLMTENKEKLLSFPSTAAIFSKNGNLYQYGDSWKQPDLAETLQRISDHGRDGFYAGKTADLIVAEMNRGQGLISHEDLKAYRSVWREPIRGTYRGHEIISMPPPSSGGILLVHMLNILEKYNLNEMGKGSAAAIHLMVEAERRAYADRAQHLGDPDFVKIPTKMLLSKEYASKRFEDFSPEKATESKKIGSGNWHEGEDTTHFSVVDQKGNAVSCTTTINTEFGSKVVVSGAGFLLNNEMDDFSAKPMAPNHFGLVGDKANEIQPGKRMLSSMTPTIVTKDGKLVMVVGSPGGSKIITSVFQVIVNVLDHNYNIMDAVNTPRVHHQWLPDRIVHEPYAILPDTMALLKQKGHQTYYLSPPIGAVNAIVVKDGKLEGAADPRRSDSAAIGYD